MENKKTDFDVDYEEKENSVFAPKKPKKIEKKIRNYFIIAIWVGIILIVASLVFVFYTKDWFGLGNPVKNNFSIIQGSDNYDCGDKYDQVIALKPTQSIEDIQIRSKELIVIEGQLKIERIALEKEKSAITDGLSLSLYKNKIEDYNLRLEKYKSDLALNQKEINDYNNKVKEYSDFLKENCKIVR
jgi:hypothetical protein